MEDHAGVISHERNDCQSTKFFQWHLGDENSSCQENDQTKVTSAGDSEVGLLQARTIKLHSSTWRNLYTCTFKSEGEQEASMQYLDIIMKEQHTLASAICQYYANLHSCDMYKMELRNTLSMYYSSRLYDMRFIGSGRELPSCWQCLYWDGLL